jgi:hypothetical protein
MNTKNNPDRIRCFYEHQYKYLGKREIDGVEYHAFQSLLEGYAPEIQLTKRAHMIMKDGTVVEYE